MFAAVVVIVFVLIAMGGLLAAYELVTGQALVNTKVVRQVAEWLLTGLIIVWILACIGMPVVVMPFFRWLERRRYMKLNQERANPKQQK